MRRLCYDDIRHLGVREMRAAVITDEGDFAVAGVADPAPGPFVTCAVGLNSAFDACEGLLSSTSEAKMLATLNG
jgi:hypothetical protein